MSKFFQELGKFADWSAEKGHIIFALYFTGYGSWLQYIEKLDYNYIMLIAAIQAFLLGHQINSNYFDQKSSDGK